MISLCVGRYGIGRLDNVAIATGHACGRLDRRNLRFVAELACSRGKRILYLVFRDVTGVVDLDGGATENSVPSVSGAPVSTVLTIKPTMASAIRTPESLKPYFQSLTKSILV